MKYEETHIYISPLPSYLSNFVDTKDKFENDVLINNREKTIEILYKEITLRFVIKKEKQKLGTKGE